MDLDFEIFEKLREKKREKALSFCWAMESLEGETERAFPFRNIRHTARFISIVLRFNPPLLHGFTCMQITKREQAAFKVNLLSLQ